MSTILILLAGVPLGTTIACLVVPHRVAGSLTALTGVATLVGALALVSATAKTTQSALGYLRADALSVVFLLATCFLYATTAIYAVGYLTPQQHGPRELSLAHFASHSRRFYVGFNAFAWSMICAPLVNGLALLWIAVEITTVISALLVALDATEGATEAAWKYVLLASSGLGIALLATIFMYYAGAQVLGQSYDLAFDPLMAAAPHLPATPVRLAFVLAVVGYGTKVGLFPMHTWLPDAHAEAPTPVSVLLSGSLLAVSFYAVLRYYQISVVTLGPHFPQRVLLVFGVLSLLLAALYLLEQRDIKRMLAYSSVEHMGILAIGISFGAPVAATGVLLHVLAHAAAKGNAFMGAGVIVHKFGTKDLTRMADGLRLLPWSGPMFVVAILALSAMPPFALFRSEFQIVAGGFSQSRYMATAGLICLVTLAFLGLMVATTRIIFRAKPVPQQPDGGGALSAGEPSLWMVVPVVAGVAVLLLLGLAPPSALSTLLQHAAGTLIGGTP
ncbi:proton-conducting transporter membrane subunit [Mycobacterium sp. 141]|uniref:proton-conducting transporter transmembrane domain-containing protein n=1 Tax=Mycobacterium sp. 141 TaxID=1120797 RepID=UPI00036C9145|nr:proton-conducting transporter membrane subunit [Mycobacterium sp. 141]